jgi:hypothetical protein
VWPEYRTPQVLGCCLFDRHSTKQQLRGKGQTRGDLGDADLRWSQPRPPLGHDGGPNCEYNKQRPQSRAYHRRGHTYGDVKHHREPVPPNVAAVADHRLDVQDRAGEIRKKQPSEHPGFP